HVSSGKFGFLFECITPEMKILSDSSWKVKKHPAYETCPAPFPNFRLSESSIRFNARNDIGSWNANDYSVLNWENAKTLGLPPVAPWNNLILRQIPQWKDFKLKSYIDAPLSPLYVERDTIITCTLPYNAQITPYIEIDAKQDNQLVEIKTDNIKGGGEPNVYAQYLSRKGVQQYESYGWMNGHKVMYKIPAGVKVLSLKYRETGYDTEFSGSFKSSDEFLNHIWQKSLRTLYITMRDNYMDCPDRERAQWWGDEVNESGEAFYALDTKSHLLFKKGMYELINWQRQDSSLFSPIPAGNWDKELSIQMLTSVGYYGFWNYYLNTGDLKPISDLYNGVRKYLKIWKFNTDGTVKVRIGGWFWGDWGDNIDNDLITNCFYYLALKGAANMADALHLDKDASEYRESMAKIKKAFNSTFWTGSAYRYTNYKGKTDDRCQALAVVSGIAEKEKYPALLEVFKTEEHASPYMEKYVLEALFQMDYVDFAIERMKRRFGDMVNNPDYTTLFEGWGIGEKGYGGGTTNHAWSGGALTILSQYLCGIEPLEPGYSLFQIIPKTGSITKAAASVQSVKGVIKSSFEREGSKFKLAVTIPSGTEAIVGIPANGISQVKLNSKTVWENGKLIKSKLIKKFNDNQDGTFLFRVSGGDYIFESISRK
ncbi:MAG: alpha-L-rhamnosidase C-terminal domain-containing protein, partial [Bacteroidota bacterium]|nr:alpha-L-rhamnosidase C-terminal domain-containing protein [Bacteroidota bacterium]